MKEHLRVGSRGSPLALAQTEEVVDRLRRVHPSVRVETVVIKTHGDEGYRIDLGTPLDGKRAFTKRIDDELLDSRIDLAVHSLKDLPAELVPELVIAAVPPRADPRDVLVVNRGSSLADLPTGARVGTSSLRRRAQVLAHRPGLEVVELHGNVGTRLRRLDTEEFDAVIVAAAGIRRLKIERAGLEPIDPDVVTPAPGQGALAIEVRADDRALRATLAAIDDPTTRRATESERSLSAQLGGGCNMPFGALATLEGARLRLRAVVATPDGRRLARADVSGRADSPDDIAREAYGRLLDAGARSILQEAA